MNHLQIAYFLTVVKYGSFSEASRRLFVAQSAVSKQIISLEKKLGIQLFIRRNRKIDLTPAGEILYRELQKYNERLEQIIDMARSVDKGKTGLLNIGILRGLDLPAEQIDYFSEFSNDYPSIQVNVKRVSFQEQIQELYIGTLDLLITFSFLTPNMQDLNSIVIGREKTMLVMSKSHAVAKYEKVKADDFLDHTYIAVAPGISQLAYINGIYYLKGIGIEPAHILHVPSYADVNLMVEFGIGYGVSSRASGLFGRESTIFLDLDKGKKEQIMEIIIVWREDAVNPVLSFCIDYIRNRVLTELAEHERTE